MAGFGAKVKLSVDRSSAAKKAFNDQIAGMIKEVKIKNIQFDVLQKDIKAAAKDISSKFEKEPIRIKKIDCKSAINQLRKDLQNIITSLSIENGVKITGLVDPSGTGEITADIKDVANAAAKGQEETNRMNAQLAVLKETMSAVSSLYKGMYGSGKVASTESDEVSKLVDKYTTLKQNIEAVMATRRANGVVTKQQIDGLQKEALEVRKIISAILNKQDAEKKAAAASVASTKQQKAEQEEYHKQLRKVNTLLIQTKKNMANWSAAKSGASSGAYKQIEEAVAKLQELKDKLLSSGKYVEDFDTIFNAARKTIGVAADTIDKAGENTKSLGTRLKSLAGAFTSLFTATRVLSAIYRSFKEMVQIVSEVDAAMTELRKVTEETEATYIRFLDTAAARAKITGSNIADTVRATADFARLGYDIADASVLADAAIVYKNVGDGIESIDQASQSIISTMQAFGIEADHVLMIVDKFNAVGNQFAISSTGIGEALLNSAAAMAAAGNTLDESIALITAANEIIQNPERVGKIVAQRYSNVS